MKKVLLLLMVMVMLISSVPTYAAELTADSQTAQSTVFYLVESTFCVIIPKNIDANRPFRLTAENMNLRAGEQVNVYLSSGNYITLTNDAGETLNAVFTANGQESDRVGSFIAEQLVSTIDILCQPTYETTPRAGTYRGTVEFVVRVEAEGV